MAVNWSRYVSDKASWTRRYAPMALEVLFELAKIPGKTITYDTLAEILHERYGAKVMHNKQHYGKALGSAAFAIIDAGRAAGYRVPPISVIIINRTGYAGKGADIFVPRLKRENYDEKDPRRQNILKKEQSKVWDFGAENWSAIEALIAEPKFKRKTELRSKGITLPAPSKGGKGEGPEHMALKAWVLANPKKLREFGLFQSGQPEARLQSGDSVDAMLWNEAMRLAVEVKPGKSPEVEMIRGIFQCVKYRHTINAEFEVDQRRLPGNSVLVSTRPLGPKERRIAKTLDVQYFQAPKTAEIAKKE